MRHLRFRCKLYPLGYPVEIAANSEQIVKSAIESFGGWRQLFDGDPVRFRVELHDGAGAVSPPRFTADGSGFRYTSEAGNEAEFSVPARAGTLRLGWDALGRRSWLRYHFLDALTLTALDTVAFTPVHAACVARDGRGLLLCGDSGAGKSSLAYAACTRGDWWFICDDAVHLRMGLGGRLVGDARRVHLREQAAALFPELQELRAVAVESGKTALDLDTSAREWRSADTAIAAGCVFLERRRGPCRLTPEDHSAANGYFRKYLSWGDAELQQRDFDLLLERGCWRLEYETAEEAVSALDRCLERAVS